MPVNEKSYQKACIYKIWSLETDKIYIGSTCDMIKRWSSHKANYKSWKKEKGLFCSSFNLFDLVGIENCKIEWIKDFPCNSKKELNKEEGRIQRLHKDIIVNKDIAGRTMKEYRQDNKQEIKENNKKYKQDHKEEIKEYKKQKHTCECGGKYTNHHKAQHLKTIKHQNFLKE